jgi:DNA-binding LytR/AlgR family response regulator
MTIRALIAEDESILATTLVTTLERLWPELSVCAVVENGIAAVQETLTQQPEILFFDIKMPGKTGLEAAQELADEWPDNKPFPLIVFVTAYDQYALEAFEQAAVDYVCKPISDERMAKTITRLQTRLQSQSTQPKGSNDELDRIVGQLRALAPTTVPAERLTIIRAAVGNQIRMIPINDVIYFEATDKYVNVVTAENESLIRTSLKELLPQLDSNQFWQIHRGTVVNASHIHMAVRDDAGKLTVKLKDRKENLAVSRLFAHLFKQM